MTTTTLKHTYAPEYETEHGQTVPTAPRSDRRARTSLRALLGGALAASRAARQAGPRGSVVVAARFADGIHS